MLTHTGIWNAIDALALRHGLSISGLARKAGLDPTTFNKSKRTSRDGKKQRWPGTESISRILEATGSTFPEFLDLLGNDPNQSPDLVSYDIPVLPWGLAKDSAYFTQDGTPFGPGWVPPELPGLDGFGLEVQGTGYAPVYRHGDILILSLHEEVHRWDRVVIQTTDGDTSIRTLSRKTALKLEFQSVIHPDETYLFDITDIRWLYKIVWVTQPRPTFSDESDL